jgi:hypothetical protein
LKLIERRKEMKNSDRPSMAFQEVEGITGGMITKYRTHTGLTKREQVFKDFMAALIARGTNYDHIAGYANDLTNEYFEELSK